MNIRSREPASARAKKRSNSRPMALGLDAKCRPRSPAPAAAKPRRTGANNTRSSGAKSRPAGSHQQRQREAKQKPTYKHIPHSQKPRPLVEKRNARERKRVQAVNEAFYKLRKSVPIENRNKRVSKVKTLQRAIDYIRKLEIILASDESEIEQQEASAELATANKSRGANHASNRQMKQQRGSSTTRSSSNPNHKQATPTSRKQRANLHSKKATVDQDAQARGSQSTNCILSAHPERPAAAYLRAAPTNFGASLADSHFESQISSSCNPPNDHQPTAGGYPIGYAAPADQQQYAPVAQLDSYAAPSQHQHACFTFSAHSSLDFEPAPYGQAPAPPPQRLSPTMASCWPTSSAAAASSASNGVSSSSSGSPAGGSLVGGACASEAAPASRTSAECSSGRSSTTTTTLNNSHVKQQVNKHSVNSSSRDSSASSLHISSLSLESSNSKQTTTRLNLHPATRLQAAQQQQQQQQQQKRPLELRPGLDQVPTPPTHQSSSLVIGVGVSPSRDSSCSAASSNGLERENDQPLAPHYQLTGKRPAHNYEPTSSPLSCHSTSAAGYHSQLQLHNHHLSHQHHPNSSAASNLLALNNQLVDSSIQPDHSYGHYGHHQTPPVATTTETTMAHYSDSSTPANPNHSNPTTTPTTSDHQHHHDSYMTTNLQTIGQSCLQHQVQIYTSLDNNNTDPNGHRPLILDTCSQAAAAAASFAPEVPSLCNNNLDDNNDTSNSVALQHQQHQQQQQHHHHHYHNTNYNDHLQPIQLKQAHFLPFATTPTPTPSTTTTIGSSLDQQHQGHQLILLESSSHNHHNIQHCHSHHSDLHNNYSNNHNHQQQFHHHHHHQQHHHSQSLSFQNHAYNQHNNNNNQQQDHHLLQYHYPSAH